MRCVVNKKVQAHMASTRDGSRSRALQKFLRGGSRRVTPFLINVNFSKFFSAQVIENDFLGGPGFWEFSPARKSRNFGDFSPIFRDF